MNGLSRMMPGDSSAMQATKGAPAKHLSYSNADADFLKRAVDLIAQTFSPAPTDRNPIFKQIVNFGLKGSLIPTIAALQRKHEGLFTFHHIFVKLQRAQALFKKVMETSFSGLTTLEDCKGLWRICQHRFNFMRYEVMIDKMRNSTDKSSAIQEVVKDIQARIEALDFPFGPSITTLESGATSFSIPGGWTKHFITYEFRKENNAFFFIIHNRGEKCADARLHGTFSLKKGEKEYKRTSVCLRASKEILLNPYFLACLVEAKCNSINNMLAYDYIHQYLIEEQKCEVVSSQIEETFVKLQQLEKSVDLNEETKNKVSQTLFQLVKQAKNFKSTQAFGSCVESNHTTCEKEMASPLVLRILKHFTLTQMVEEIDENYLKKTEGEKSFSEEVLTEAKLIHSHAQSRLEQLTAKIQANPPPAPFISLEQVQQLIKECHQKIEKARADKDVIMKAQSQKRRRERDDEPVDIKQPEQKKRPVVILKPKPQRAFWMPFNDLQGFNK
jgi:hypothetical protein